MEAPSKTGNSGRMQGAAAVSRPAANASTISIMSGSPRRSGRYLSLHQGEQWFALFDDVGGELTPGHAARVPGRMGRLGWNEEDVAGLQCDRRLVADLILELAFEHINDLFARMRVPAERHAGSEVDAHLDSL